MGLANVDLMKTLMDTAHCTMEIPNLLDTENSFKSGLIAKRSKTAIQAEGLLCPASKIIEIKTIMRF